MKRKIIALAVLIFMLCLMVVPAFAAPTLSYARVVDNADLLTWDEEGQLAYKLDQVSQTYNAQITIVTIPNADGKDLDTYIENFYDEGDYGYGESHDGILLLLCMDPREYRILSNGFAANAITNSRIDAICDIITPDLSDGNYAAAFDQFADQCAYYLDGYLNGFPFNFSKNLMIALVIGIVVGLIVALALKAQLKTVRQENRAHAYIKPGSLQVTNRFDLFLYRNVTRTKKESSSSSGSRSGSSRNVGGRSF